MLITNKQDLFRERNIKNNCKNEKGEPVKLFKTETTSVVVVNLVNRMFKNLPCLVGVFGIHHHAMLKRLYLEISLLLVTHFQLLIPISIPTTQNQSFLRTQIPKPPEIREKTQD